MDYLQYIRDAKRVEPNYIVFDDKFSGGLAIEAIAAMKVLLNTALWADHLKNALFDGAQRPDNVKFSAATPAVVSGLAAELAATMEAVTNRTSHQQRMLLSLLGMWTAVAQIALPLFEHCADGKSLDWEAMLFKSGDLKVFMAILDDVITDKLDLAPESIFSANIIKLRKKYPMAFKDTTEPSITLDVDTAQDDKDRVVYGVVCTWWGLPSEASKQPNTDLPCCPHCKGLLYSVATEMWSATQEEHASALKDENYLEYMQWLKGRKCWGTKDGYHTAARKVFDNVLRHTTRIDSKREDISHKQ